ncbi:uncharacterized protein EHS24_006477 [Apiotrichum porosum]|uniref:Metallo-beta-lactamase domain-containing protein n=1 Tax=Apiotrichum porosum TaxID=105984 RepID=A0A427Y1L0_9TREE|nr:uncharacterized protein EHS24_006477 [Apiotrichum porosum]RSH84930.1 hypothetical protein EHS24_006477 [Apiotrichum porosum]
MLIESEVLLNGTSNATRRPSFVFLIHHPVSNEYLLWDLGIRKEFELDYPHPSFAYFQTHFEEDVSDTLASIGIKASQISKVLISHKHWDHTGNPAPYNNATFYIGAKDVSEVATLKGSERVMSYRAHWEDESIPPSHSFNEDVAQSETHLSRMRACEASKDIQVVIAHDEAKWKDWFGGENYGLGPELGKV